MIPGLSYFRWTSAFRGSECFPQESADRLSWTIDTSCTCKYVSLLFAYVKWFFQKTKKTRNQYHILPATSTWMYGAEIHLINMRHGCDSHDLHTDEGSTWGQPLGQGFWTSNINIFRALHCLQICLIHRITMPKTFCTSPPGHSGFERLIRFLILTVCS